MRKISLFAMASALSLMSVFSPLDIPLKSSAVMAEDLSGSGSGGGTGTDTAGGGTTNGGSTAGDSGSGGTTNGDSGSGGTTNGDTGSGGTTNGDTGSGGTGGAASGGGTTNGGSQGAGTGGGTTGGGTDTIIENRKGSISIVRTDTDRHGLADVTLAAHRVMNIVPDTTSGNSGYMSISLNTDFSGSAASGISPDSLQNYSASALEALAVSLEKFAIEHNLSGTTRISGQDGSAVFDNLDPGWYLVRETVTPAGSLPIAPFLIAVPSTQTVSGEDSWLYDVSASPKAPSISLEKQITNGKGVYNNSLTYEGKADTVGLGDTVDYQLTTVVPNYSDAYFADNKSPVFEIKDILSDGLTIKPETIKVYMKNAQDQDTEISPEGAFTKTAQPVSSASEPDLTISFSRAFLMDSARKGKAVTVRYSATVNENAVMGTSGNPNDVTLYYYDSPYSTEPVTLTDETKVYTFKLLLYKFDADAGTDSALSGARFALYKESSQNATAAQSMQGTPFMTLTSTSGGYLDFNRLDAGVYYLKETKAPDGYSLLTNPIKVEIRPNTTGDTDPKKVQDGSFSFFLNGSEITQTGSKTDKGNSLKVPAEGIALLSVGNHKGFTLPATGGRGVYMIVLSALAAMLLLIFFTFNRRGRNNTGSRPGTDSAF